LGGKDVNVPQSVIQQLQSKIAAKKQADQQPTQTIGGVQVTNTEPYEIENLKNMLYGSSAVTLDPLIRKSMNDKLFALQAEQQKKAKGIIKINPYEDVSAQGENPLTSMVTSIGRGWAEPTSGGYRMNEKFDFEYAKDKERIRPTLEAVSTGIVSPLFHGGASPAVTPEINALTDLARSVVMKMRTSPGFNYSVYIPETK
jgi:hypothetical protein